MRNSILKGTNGGYFRKLELVADVMGICCGNIIFNSLPSNNRNWILGSKKLRSWNILF